jgi:uncharacterized protein (TIGR02147 family)
VDGLYDYTDYRDLLRDAYRQGKDKNARMSYRMIGRILDVDASFLVKVMRGESHLPEASLPALEKFLKLDSRGARFLRALFLYTHARTPTEMKSHFEEMMRIRGVGARALDQVQYAFYEHWRHTVVWAMLHCVPDRTPEWYAQAMRPQVQPRDVEDSLEILTALGLLQRAEDGTRRLVARHLETGDPLVKSAIRSFHQQMIELARQGVETIPPEERDISGITIAVDAECLRDVRAIVREARKKIQLRVDEVETADRVMQVNVQVFPLTGCLA